MKPHQSNQILLIHGELMIFPYHSVRFLERERLRWREMNFFKEWDLNLKVRITGELLMGILFWNVLPFYDALFHRCVR